MKINLGSNRKKLDGYLNVDGLDIENVDIVHDLTIIPYPFEDRSVDEILMMEVLEHLPRKFTHKCLTECYRILKPGGELNIQVPDIGRMCEMYVNRETCDCVPRKTANIEDFKANPNCKFCNGKAKIHPDRWRTAFSGAQKHEFDNHLNHFTEGILNKSLMDAGFADIEFNNNIYKLIVKAKKL